ncbi:MAG: SH3 domain-containing protein [Ruminococcus sp.]|nr:SH3 domain-containing protein [Ruminococcus sp.]
MKKAKIISAAMALALTFSAGAGYIPQFNNTSSITASAAPAPSNGVVRHVNADGVRLRTAPGGGTILGLMYKGEKIKFLSKIPSGWSYVYRYKTGQYGWMATNYISK